eukprot:4279978-Pleurochrysis_carterae.AAC.1
MLAYAVMRSMSYATSTSRRNSLALSAGHSPKAKARHVLRNKLCMRARQGQKRLVAPPWLVDLRKCSIDCVLSYVLIDAASLGGVKARVFITPFVIHM